MGSRRLLAALAAIAVSSCFHGASGSASTFGDDFEITGAEDHVKTSADGQTWYLYLDQKTGVGFQTKQRYLFGWFSMKLKLVGNDSAGVVTAYYMCSDVDAAPQRDELDFEFLGNRTGQPYIIQTNVYHNGVGGREMRHSLWFDPTADFHTYSILWNAKHIVFFVDKVPIRVYPNDAGKPGNSFFPIAKPMYVFSSIWNADDWATRGGLEKTDWTKGPFISSYRDFATDACSWPTDSTAPPACAAATGDSWWDQPPAWALDGAQREDSAWVGRNLVIYDYCSDRERYPAVPEECALRATTAS
ncbi:probable xyloglucan endotransglucosylase/hydrolase protein 8 [Phragmites australis]|uniref:probable xyloglucan endotransglucosylase/hydrolase protein 8 n=1 Tax=Phragmites australis TaxID=29695 RepID=UPI002D773674|nr:probable xyloglucan endotransglucosylase/hydrolase protein 8 [Phragmites australis]